MKTWTVLLGMAALLVLPACQGGFWGDEPEGSNQAEMQEQSSAATAQQQAEQEEFYGQAPKAEDVPETITLQAKNGNVNFSHQDHAEQMDCTACHEGTPGKIPGFDKNKAHSLCKGCHQDKGAGPTKCNECHKKS